MFNEQEKPSWKTIGGVWFEFHQILEDDASMRQITPMPEIEERLEKLFGKDLVTEWQKSRG
jgi:hypothetical protein